MLELVRYRSYYTRTIFCLFQNSSNVNIFRHLFNLQYKILSARLKFKMFFVKLKIKVSNLQSFDIWTQCIQGHERGYWLGVRNVPNLQNCGQCLDIFVNWYCEFWLTDKNKPSQYRVSTIDWHISSGCKNCTIIHYNV